MPIIYKAAKSIVRSVSYGIALSAGDKSGKDVAKDFFGNVLTDEITTGVNQLNSSQEMYWSPYADVPGVGNVYSVPSIVVNANTMYSFYQGQALYSTDGGVGGYPYYTARQYGTFGSDQVCTLSLSTVNPPSSAISAVMFGGKVYAFYGGMPGSTGQTGQIWFTSFDSETSCWSPLTQVPNLTVPSVGTASQGTCGVYPVAFTPPGAQTEQLFLFYPMKPSGWNEWTPLDIGCMATADGQTWTNLAPDGMGASLSPTNSGISPIVYGAPGADSEQIYVFHSGENLAASYIVYPDSTGGFGAPVAIPSVEGTAWATSATVQTSPDGTEKLVYVFFLEAEECGIEPWDGTGNPVGFGYSGYSLSYTTFDGSAWSTPTPLPNGLTLDAQYGSTLAVFPPESFNNAISSVPDVYFSMIQNGLGNVYVADYDLYSVPNLQSTTAAFVSSISNSANALQVTPFATDVMNVGATSACLLAVDLPGSTVPQPWLFYFSYDTSYASGNSFGFKYAVYDQGQWTPGLQLPVAVEGTFPEIIGSPAVLPVSMDDNSESIGIVAFNTALGMLATNGGGTGWVFPPTPTPISGVSATGSPSLAFFNNQACLFYQDADSHSLYCTTAAPTFMLGEALDWCAPFVLNDAQLSDSPSAVVFDGDLYVFYQGVGDCGTLWYSCLSGSTGTWSASIQVVPEGVDSSTAIMSGSPSACVCTDAAGNSQLFVMYGGVDSGSGMPLMCCSTSTGTTWTQTAAPGVFIAASPFAYSGLGTGKINVFFQFPSSPGELVYSIYDPGKCVWSPTGTTPIATIDGWPSGMMFYESYSNQAWLYLYHNNSGVNAGQLSCCTCTPMSTAQACLIGNPVGIDPDNTGTFTYYAAMEGAPSATTANGNIYMFYNGTHLTSDGSAYVPGALTYMQMPLPAADCQQVNLGLPTPATVGHVEDGPDGTAGFIAMVSSPAAATFQGMPYVFFNTGNAGIDYCTDPSTGGSQALITSSVADNCTPAALVCNNVLYVFWVQSGSDSAGALQCSYTVDGSTWGQIDLSPGLTVNSEGVIASDYNGLIYLMYSQNGVTYYNIFPQVNVQSAQTVSLGLAPATQISRMNCSTGPSVAVLDNILWCVTQGVEASGYSAAKGWSLEPNGQLFFSRTLDAACWSWNTAITQAGASSVAPLSSTMPIATTYPSPATGEDVLYVFWPAATGGYIQYATTSGTYLTPSASAYGLPWSVPTQISNDVYTNDNVAAVAMPPLDSPGYPNQLYVFWQGANHSGSLFYATMSPEGSWSGCTEVVPVGCNPDDAFMSLSPSAVYYAPEGGTPQPYVFYQRAGSSGKVGDCIELQYCTYADGTWTQSEVPSITSTITSEWDGVQMAPPQTINGIDAGTPPRAISFNGKLYVFYVSKTGGYTSDSSGKGAPYTGYPVSYSTFDGSAWSGLNIISSTATFQKQTNNVAPYYVAQLVYPVELNGTLYVFFMSGPSWGSTPSVDPPGAIYYTSTPDGLSWSTPQPTTDVVFVPASTTTLSNSLGTEVNDTVTAINGALSFVGLQSVSDIRNTLVFGGDDDDDDDAYL